MSFAKPALLGPEKVSVGSNARELWGRNEPYSGMPPVQSIWSAPRGSPGMQNSVVPDAPANAGKLRTQRIVCSQRGHLGRNFDMPEQKPQKPPTGYSGIAPTDYPSRSLRTQQDWKLELQLSIPSLVCCSCSAAETHPPKKKAPASRGQSPIPPR